MLLVVPIPAKSVKLWLALIDYFGRKTRPTAELLCVTEWLIKCVSTNLEVGRYLNLQHTQQSLTTLKSRVQCSCTQRGGWVKYSYGAPTKLILTTRNAHENVTLTIFVTKLVRKSIIYSKS